MEIIEQKIYSTFVLRFLKDENIIETLINFFNEHSEYKGAVLTAIGAVSYVDLGYFDGQEYQRFEIQKDLEILSLVGNVSYNSSNEIVIHVHGVFGPARPAGDLARTDAAQRHSPVFQ